MMLRVSTVSDYSDAAPAFMNGLAPSQLMLMIMVRATLAAVRKP